MDPVSQKKKSNIELMNWMELQEWVNRIDLYVNRIVTYAFYRIRRYMVTLGTTDS